MAEQNWFELQDLESWQEEAWQNRVNGEVLSLEQVGPNKFNVITLPENYKDDNQPIEQLVHEDTRKMATGAALGYMRNGEVEV